MRDEVHRMAVEGALAPTAAPIPGGSHAGIDVAAWARSAMYAVETRRGPDPCNDGRDGLSTVAMYTLEPGPDSVVTSNPGAKTASVFLSGKMTRYVPAHDYCADGGFVVAEEGLGVFRMAWKTTGHAGPMTFTANDQDASPQARLPTFTAVCDRVMTQVVPTYQSLEPDWAALLTSHGRSAPVGGPPGGTRRGGGSPLSLPPAPPGLLTGDASVFIQAMHGARTSAKAAQTANDAKTFVTRIADTYYGNPGKTLQSLGRGVAMSALNDLATRHVTQTANEFLGGMSRMMEKYREQAPLPENTVKAVEEPQTDERYYSVLVEHFVGMLKDTCDELAKFDDGSRPDGSTHGFLYGPNIGTRLEGWAPMGMASAHSAGPVPGLPGYDVASMLDKMQASGVEVPAIAPEHMAMITSQKPALQGTAGTSERSFPETPAIQVHFRMSLLDEVPPPEPPIVSPDDPRLRMPPAEARALCEARPPVRIGEIFYGGHQEPDWVELHQAPHRPPPGSAGVSAGGDRDVSMAGWHFESGPRRYRIPNDTTLTAGGAFLLRGETFGFDLHLGGPALRLVDEKGCMVDEVQPLPAPHGVEVPSGHTHQQVERVVDGIRTLQWQASAEPGGSPGVR